MAVELSMEHFSEVEALALASTVPVGRIVHSRYALPAVFVVNFKLDGRDVVLRTRKGPLSGAGVHQGRGRAHHRPPHSARRRRSRRGLTAAGMKPAMHRRPGTRY
ncbi:hypothetical protein ABH926_006471 [Catenulispora sp. GP43]|uniref:hypothetical protein n=1 Tax=Catenulispora sp. GP43 TaxID=3156263 RepID=UPI0035143F0E